MDAISSDISMPTENASLCTVEDWWQRIAYQPEKEIMRLCGSGRKLSIGISMIVLFLTAAE